jgi:hypothetical protein
LKLNLIGEKLYNIDENNSENNKTTKFKKTHFIMSTICLIDNLFEKDFDNYLRNAKKLELSKPNENEDKKLNHIITKRKLKLLKKQELLNRLHKNQSLNNKRIFTSIEGIKIEKSSKHKIINSNFEEYKNKTKSHEKSRNETSDILNVSNIKIEMKKKNVSPSAKNIIDNNDSLNKNEPIKLKTGDINEIRKKEEKFAYTTKCSLKKDYLTLIVDHLRILF